MARLIIIICAFVLSFNARAQWEQMQVLYGGNLFQVNAIGDNLIAGQLWDRIYISSDKGQNWNKTAMPYYLTMAVYKNTIYTANDDTLYISNDNAKSYSRLNIDVEYDIGHIYNIHIIDSNLILNTEGGTIISSNLGITWDYLQVDTLYEYYWIGFNSMLNINEYTLGATSIGIYKSTDSGLNWESYALKGKTIINLVNNGTHLFAATNPEGLFVSDDNGISWEQINSKPCENKIRAIATNDIGTFISTQEDGVFLSIDNGKNWQPTNTGLPNNSKICYLFAEGNNLYAASRGKGLFKTSNNGNSWEHSSVEINTLSVNALLYTNDKLIAGTFGGGIYYSDNTNLVPGGLMPSIKSLYSNSDKIYAGSTEGLFYSDDNAVTFNYLGPYQRQILSIYISGDTIFVGTLHNGIFKSALDNTNWKQTDNGIPPHSSVNCIIKKDDKLLVGTDEDGVFSSANNGSLWTQANNDMANSNIKALFVDGDKIFAGTADKGVYCSIDNGLSWEHVGLDGKCIVGFTSNNEKIYAATYKSGVFYTTNSVPTMWYEFSTGLSNQLIKSFTNDENNIFIGSETQGIWKYTLATTANETKNNECLKIFPNPVKNVVTISGNEFMGKVKIEIISITGDKVISRQITSFEGLNESIDIKALENGIYIVCVVTSKQTCTKSIIISN